MSRSLNAAGPTSRDLVVTSPPLVVTEARGISASVRAELERLVDVVADLQAASHADSTIERYTRQWERFAAWCAVRGLPSSLPVHAQIIMLYVADWATTMPPPAHGTIVQALAAIDWVHTSQKLAPPRSGELDKLRRGVRNRLGVAPKRKAAPLLLEHLVPLGQYLLSPTRTQVRDAVVIALRSLGLSYAEISSRAVTDVAVTAEGFTLRLARRTVSISHRDDATSPHAILTRWLELRGSGDGPLICRLTSDDSVTSRPIALQSVRSIILKWANRSNATLTHGTALNSDEASALLAAALNPPPSHVRDMACIWLLWAGALRSDELIHVRLGHITVDERGLTLTIPRSKTDQAGQGLVAFVPRGEHVETDVVGAVEHWVTLLRTAGAVNETHLLCPIDRHENLCLFEEGPDGSLNPASPVNGPTVTYMLRQALIGAKIEVARVAAFSSHSGKRGIATQLAHAKADISEIAKVTRHKSLQTVKGYIDEEQRKSTSALLGLDL